MLDFTWNKSVILFLAAFSFSPTGIGQQLSVVEHPLATSVPIGGSPNALTSGPDGAVWFGSVGIGRITVAGNINYYPGAAPNAIPFGITTGPDGALWFTAQTSIGRVTTGGMTSQFPLGGGRPGSIVTGPDGALWFTNQNRIGRISTAGIITQFPVPSQNSEKIVAGPDGALWFTEGYAGKIGRITIDGVITEFVPPGSNPTPTGIAVGGDGALWFTDIANELIGRVTTSGQFAEYLLPPTQNVPVGIVSGPDNALWFTVYNLHGPSYIGRITLQGAISLNLIPGTFVTQGDIIVGPDGNLWFAEPGGDRIGQVQFPKAALSIAPADGRVGTPLTVSGTGFVAGEQINLFADSVSAYSLGSTTATPTGDFLFATSIWNGSYLDHSIRAVGQTSGNAGVATFAIEPAAIPNQPNVAAGGTLTVRGSGFVPFQNVSVTFTQNSRNSLGSGIADYRGQFTAISATIPVQVPPGAVQLWVGGNGPSAITSIQVNP